MGKYTSAFDFSLYIFFSPCSCHEDQFTVFLHGIQQFFTYPGPTQDPPALTGLLLWFCLERYFKFSSHITQEIFLLPFNVRFVLFVSLFVCVFVQFSCQVSFYVVVPPFCNYFENSFSITSILPRRTSRFIPPTLFKRRRP